MHLVFVYKQWHMPQVKWAASVQMDTHLCQESLLKCPATVMKTSNANVCDPIRQRLRVSFVRPYALKYSCEISWLIEVDIPYWRQPWPGWGLWLPWWGWCVARACWRWFLTIGGSTAKMRRPSYCSATEGRCLLVNTERNNAARNIWTYSVEGKNVLFIRFQIYRI